MLLVSLSSTGSQWNVQSHSDGAAIQWFEALTDTVSVTDMRCMPHTQAVQIPRAPLPRPRMRAERVSLV